MAELPVTRAAANFVMATSTLPRSAARTTRFAPWLAIEIPRYYVQVACIHTSRPHLALERAGGGEGSTRRPHPAGVPV
jgi:hypothetical protein